MREVYGPLTRLGESYAAARANLETAIDGLDAATRWLVDTYQGDPRAAAAVAVPYLKLFGVVAGGWLMARAALIAQRSLDEPGSDRDFLTAKLVTARFYAEHILPQARSLADTVVSGSASVLALTEDQF